MTPTSPKPRIETTSSDRDQPRPVEGPHRPAVRHGRERAPARRLLPARPDHRPELERDDDERDRDQQAHQRRKAQRRDRSRGEDEHQGRQRAGQQEQDQQAAGRDVGDRRRAGRGDGVERDRDVGGGHPIARSGRRRPGARCGPSRRCRPSDPAARRGPGGARRGPSSRSGARRRSPPRCRRGSTRGTAAGRATRGRRGTSRWSRRPGRWPSASGSQIETRRRDRSAATSRRRRRRPEPVGYSTVNVVAERLVPAQHRLDEQVVDREPDRAAPVGVAAEQVVRRLAGLVVDRREVALDLDPERLVAVPARQGPQPVRREERRPRRAPRAARARGARGGRRLRIIDSPPGASTSEPRRRSASSVTPSVREERARSACRARPRARPPRAAPSTAGRIGSSPTIEWIRSGTADPSGSRSGRRRTRRPRPTGRSG